MSGWILAVDFGTVNTGAAIRFADGRIDKVKLDPNSDTMPSAVVVTDGRWRVGQAALNARRTHPDTFIGSPKTRLGQEPVVLGQDLVSPATIASHLLAAVRERAIRTAAGTEPDRLVLTHPVRWGRARLTALQEAAQAAGFAYDTIRLLPEPIAALHAHVSPGSLPPGSRVAVVDTGGGTCDVAILQTTDDPAPGKDLLVVAQEGDDRLGGNDLDDLLYQWVLAQLKASGRTDMATALADPEHLGAALTLLDVVRSAKQDLSEHTNAPIGVAVAGHETTLTVTREEYEDLIAEPMTRVGALTTRALRASGTTDLAGLYLTGGTAYTPALAQTLHKVTGILTAPLGDPKLAVAVGALKTPVAVMTPTQLATLTHQLTQQRQQPHTPPPPQAPTPRPPQAALPPVQPPTVPARPTQTLAAPTQPAHLPPAPTRPASPPSSSHTSITPDHAPTGYTPSPGPSAPNNAHSGRPVGPAQPPRQVPPRQHSGGSGSHSGNGAKIAVGVLAGLLVLAVIGLGTWWFALRDDGQDQPEASQAPTDQTCWDGTTTDDCPAFEGTAAALYVFGPEDETDAEECEPSTTYVPSGWTSATSCYIASQGAIATISQWPTPEAAATAYKKFGYEKNDAEQGVVWSLEIGSTLYAAACLDKIPFCIEFSGSDDEIDAMHPLFHAPSQDQVQALADYIASQ